MEWDRFFAALDLLLVFVLVTILWALRVDWAEENEEDSDGRFH